ncbi:MAG TPA: hypothetical protein VFS43_09835 [Polyangiaceae bacterium]|nr:hypothetical protein [Polyangiaceae bacterium]
MGQTIISRCLQVFVALSLASCGGDDPASSNQQPVASPCAGLPVDRFKELVIVEPSVIGDARARNDANGPWSFRHLIEKMVPPGISPSDFVQAWVGTYDSQTRFNRFTVPSRPRADEVLLCPWLLETPENGCDSTCTNCTARTLDMAKAPFRLIALTNRIDLRLTEAAATAGESRFVFAATRGPGDDPASPPLRMTVGIEYRNPSDEGRTARYWAERWHQLGAHATYDGAFLNDLESLYAQVVARPANGELSWLNQIRTNEVEFDWQWDMREFLLSSGGLQLAATARTPDKSVNGTQALADFVRANREAILLGQHTIPKDLEGAFAQITAPWVVPGVDETLRNAFANSTCDGCHQSRQELRTENFHISPFDEGAARLSRFLNDPANPENDELARRAASLRDALCGN